MLHRRYVAKAKGGGDGIGKTKAGKGVKIMVLADARGLPVAIDTMSASPHESQLVQRLFEFMLTEENPQRMIGDKAYDSDKLDQEMAEEGIELIAPHRSNRKLENYTQDGRPLRRYKRRWTVERTIAWIQHFRRLCIRWEKSTTLFQGVMALVRLARSRLAEAGHSPPRSSAVSASSNAALNFARAAL